MKETTLVILFISLSIAGFSQVDYLEIENQLQRSCGVPDSITLIQNQTFLDSIIQLEIINGKEKLLRDIGMLYYKRYLKWKDLADIEKSKDYHTQNWDSYESTLSLWNLASCYKILGDCSEQLRLTELYIKVMKEKEEFISYKQVYLRYKFCK